jgi:hypothetical protein
MPGTIEELETQLAEAQAEATRLREHNATLLSEKKQLAKDLAKLQDDHEAATATLQRLQLDGPVDALLSDIAVDGKLFRALFAEQYQFALDDEGRPCVRTLEGEPVMVQRANGPAKPLPFDGVAIREFLCPPGKERDPEAARWARVLLGSRASGGGGGHNGGSGGARTPEEPKREPTHQQFGLR